jgi:UDP-MurNAc hydroxylase
MLAKQRLGHHLFRASPKDSEPPLAGPPAATVIGRIIVEFQTLSHAGLRVAVNGCELLCDPWLVGSTYWRSWWNYPPVPRELVEQLKPDFIYLTHLHWDHFQADSLRLFPKDVQMLVPYDRYGRMTRDLKAIGKTNIRELRHGERVELAPGLAVRSFQFSPFITDSALAIEADGQVLLNANDAKFVGMPLRHIRRIYPQVDFCFRSHSSANARACHHYLDAPDELVDDNEHYLRAFGLFMEAVKPRYAIPFASNNCLLHDDVYALNHLTQTPLAVRDYFTTFAAKRGLQTKLQIMIPGDSWSPERGFELREHDYFTNRDAHLEAYRARVQPAMEKQRGLEARTIVPVALAEKFFAGVSRNIPRFLKRPLRNKEVLLVARSERETTGFAVDLFVGKVRQVPESDFEKFDARIVFPALILKQALGLNMFGHAAISKRVHYYATKAAMPILGRFQLLLELTEAEVLPLRDNVSRRAIRALLPRWREGILYSQILVDLARGREMVSLEEKYLAKAA